MDVPLIFFFFIFYAVRCRLIALRKFIENRDCEPKYIQSLYKSSIDSTETIKKAFDPIALNNLTGHATESAMLLSSLMVIFAPAIAAGTLSNEVNKIKVHFHNVLLEEKEKDIQKLISYIEARPFKFTVLGVIPLDATLPMIVLNLCVTYIIVVLQLTHLY
ncbi:uncharacterized protein [Maniola hyperantus]|uniref:uncharacterized protein n=1 Tax=Aphantopus hyperantus TaxID=2795564 RepID=UPI003747A88E